MSKNIVFIGMVILLLSTVLYVKFYVGNTFHEDFETLHSDRWTINEFTFPDCGSEMRREAVATDNSKLVIAVDVKDTVANTNSDASVTKRTLQGGEVGSVDFFGYGKFTVRMRNQIKPGTVSSFFLMNEWKEKDWEHKEIDIEFLGKNPSVVQFTVHHYANGGTDHVQYQHLHQLGFDSSEDFHEYSIIWMKDSILWLVDDTVVHQETRIVPDVKLQIRMNHWSSNPEVPWTIDWLGSVDKNALPSVVYYDWVKYEENVE